MVSQDKTWWFYSVGMDVGILSGAAILAAGF